MDEATPVATETLTKIRALWKETVWGKVLLFECEINFSSISFGKL